MLQALSWPMDLGGGLSCKVQTEEEKVELQKAISKHKEHPGLQQGADSGLDPPKHSLRKLFFFFI